MTRNNHWMRAFILVVFSLLLFSSTDALAQDVYYPPGSYRLEYGGIYKVLVAQSNNFLKSRWLDQEEILYDEGLISHSELRRRNQRIYDHLADWRHGLPWYYRRWWESLPEEKGGAPETLTVIRIGTTHILVDLGIIYLTNALELKWRGFQVAVDLQKKSSITLGVGKHLVQPRYGWKFKFYPNIKISTRELITDPLYSIRRINMNVGGIYTKGGQGVFALIFAVGYELEEMIWTVGIQISFLRW